MLPLVTSAPTPDWRLAVVLVVLVCLAVAASSLGGLGVGRDHVTAAVRAIVQLAIVSTVIAAVAPTFGAAKNSASAAKVAAYAPTPAWVAGLFQLVPIVGGLITFIGAVYALYLLYLGLMRVMKSPADKAIAYTVVVVLIAIVVGYVASVVTAAIGLGSSIGML